MPLVIKSIDAIARQRQRDVLFVEFHPQADSRGLFPYRYDWQTDPQRQRFLTWLDEQNIVWRYCGEFASESCFRAYLGQVYIDLPMDETNKKYCRVRDYLERLDGSMRYENIRFFVLPLAVAMRNAHHDEPGFWERFDKNL